MTNSNCILPQHENHTHPHGPECGHTGVAHDDHVCYLHDGHLHYPHGNHIDEHAIDVSETNPQHCTPGHECEGHAQGHVHGPDCGHEAVPHGNHVDYLVGDHLHYPHDGHCDDHGPVKTVG